MNCFVRYNHLNKCMKWNNINVGNSLMIYNNNIRYGSSNVSWKRQYKKKWRPASDEKDFSKYLNWKNKLGALTLFGFSIGVYYYTINHV